MESLVAREQGDEHGCVDAENRLPNAGDVEQQKHANERSESVVTDSFLTFFVHDVFSEP
jgi:hypothetical protein